MTPRTARHAALHGLVDVELGRKDRLRDALDLGRLAARDRDFAWELAQGTERMRLTLDFVLGRFVAKRLPRTAVPLTVLRMGAYQLLMMSRVPARAAVHETVELLRDNRGFPNAVLRRLAEHVQERAADPRRLRRELPLPAGPDGARSLVFDADAMPEATSAGYLAVRFGLPGFLVQRWVDAHGFDATRAVCEAASAAPSVYLRPTWRLSGGEPSGGESSGGETLDAVLAAEGVTVTRLEAPMFRVESGAPFATEAFRAGLFVAQDPTAHAAALAVGARPGERVLDVCAAPGTKAMVLAEAVGPTGRVLACDARGWKLRFVRENAVRLGLTDRVEYPESAIPAESVDRALADVPCSNTGVLSRRVEVRRRISPEAIAELGSAQRDCLRRAMLACRPGGTVVYSTCSIEPEENRELVDSLLAGELAASGEFVTDRLTLPRAGRHDGGYFAVLRRKG